MVNATQMAKLFGDSKRPKNWLVTNQSQELISELSKGRNLPLADLVIVKKGGSNPGTWFHEDVALLFAQWLSPRLYIWCNDRIKELMKFGMTATPQTIESILQDPGNAAKILTALQEERKRNAVLKDQVQVRTSEHQRLLKLHQQDYRKIEKLEKRVAVLEKPKVSKPTNYEITKDEFKQMMHLSAEIGAQKFVREYLTPTNSQYFTISGYARLHNISVNLPLAQQLGIAATKICEIMGYMIDDCPDSRFGRVNMYPKDVLDEVFSKKGGAL
jgi:hypothetical protein